MSIDEAIEGFLRTAQFEYGYSQHTIKAYRNDLRSLRDFITPDDAQSSSGSFDVTLIDLELLRAWLFHKQQQSAAPASIARSVATVKSFGSWLEQRHVVSGSPATRLHTPKKSSSLPRVLSVQQMTRILERSANAASSQDPQLVRDHAILELLYATAIRVSELCQLDLSDIDNSAHTIRVIGKGNKQRVVPYGNRARSALGTYLDSARTQLQQRYLTQPTAHVFLSNAGGALSPSFVYRLVSRALADEPGSGPSGPHTFRHTAATHLLDGGADLRVVQEFLGHSSLASTQVYTHVSVDRLARTYQQAHPRA